VKGWEVALLTMAVGETVALRLAPEFAYGFTGSKGIGSQVTIPPGATLDFKVEIVSVTPGEKVVTLDEENRARLAQVRAERAAAAEAAVKAKEAQAAAKAEVGNKKGLFLRKCIMHTLVSVVTCLEPMSQLCLSYFRRLRRSWRPRQRPRARRAKERAFTSPRRRSRKARNLPRVRKARKPLRKAKKKKKKKKRPTLRRTTRKEKRQASRPNPKRRWKAPSKMWLGAVIEF